MRYGNQYGPFCLRLQKTSRKLLKCGCKALPLCASAKMQDSPTLLSVIVMDFVIINSCVCLTCCTYIINNQPFCCNIARIAILFCEINLRVWF